MKARIILVLLVLALCVSAQASSLRIGVIQIVEHPSLDAAQKGFMDGLAAAGVEARYDVQIAQGDMAVAQAIAQKFVLDRVDMILAIATPTAQAAANATNTIPILITAVTDPVSARLVKSIEAPGTNVTGTSDLTPVAKQLELLKRIAPKAQRVGMIYNSGESNSQVQAALARQVASQLGLRLVEATASNSAEVHQAAQSLVGRVDAIYVFTDNTVVSALESVVFIAESNRIPLIVGEPDSVNRGGLATVGIDYYTLGQQTAKIALEVIGGKSPSEIPVQYLSDESLVINLKAAKAIGLQFPAEILGAAAVIIE